MSRHREIPLEPRISLPEPALHGGPDYAELASLGVSVQSILDFSVNINPLGASPRAVRSMGVVDPSRYPDPESLRLRGALAAHHDVSVSEVVLGNGSVELIWLLAQLYLTTGDRALIVGPTFGEYEVAVRRAGAEIAWFQSREEDDFQIDIDRLRQAILAARPRVVFVCHPNNPTGQALDMDELEIIRAACGEAMLIIDEAYLDLADGVPSGLLLPRDSRTVVLRSLTKGFGLAGLRLGYAIADSQVARAVGLARPPWTVNAIAQAAGLAALGDLGHVDAGQCLASRSKAMLVDGLGGLGLRCVPSRTTFWLVRVGDAANQYGQLLHRGILVRDCSSFGLPGHIRIAARPLDECQRLLQVLGGLVSSEAGAPRGAVYGPSTRGG